MFKSQFIIRSVFVGALALGLAACESAPQYDSSLSGAGGGRSGDPSMSGTGGRDVSATGLGGSGTPSNLTEAQRMFTAEVGNMVRFDYDSYALRADGPAILDRQAGWLKRFAQYNIVIEGHADERGTREYNLALAERRATTVKTYLVNQGIPAGRISVISYGKERPVALGANEAAWAENRRAVTVLGQ